MKRILACLVALAMVAAFMGCKKPEKRQAVGEMDTPEHHVAIAERMLLEKGDWSGAHSEYQKALELKRDYVPALIGDAVYYAAHEKNAQKAEELRSEAWSHTNGNKERELAYYIGAIQLYTYLKGKESLEKAEEAFKSGIKIDPNNEKLHFFMGKAYVANLEFNNAEKMFKKVIEINGPLRRYADELWAKIDKIVRARPGSVAAKKIALVDSITKADVAALFVEEMNLPRLWQTRGIKKWEPPAFMTPEQAAKVKQEGGPTATDIAGHPLESDIKEVLKLGIRGIEVDPSGKFYPDKPITRAEYAVMLEDILIKVLNEQNLAAKYTAEAESKFHDMRTDNWAYNAAVVVTSRGILPPDMEGNFKPMDPVSGADALLVIRQMMDYLKL